MYDYNEGNSYVKIREGIVLADPILAGLTYRRSASAGNGGFEGSGPFTFFFDGSGGDPAITPIASGDLIVVFIGTDGGSSITETEALFNRDQHVSTSEGSAHRAAIFSRVADGSEDHITFQPSSFQGLDLIAVKIQNWSPWSSLGSSENDQNPTAPELQASGKLWLAYFSWDAGTNILINLPSPWNLERHNDMNSASGFSGGCSSVLYSLSSSALSRGPASITCDSINEWVAYMVAFGELPPSTGNYATIVG